MLQTSFIVILDILRKETQINPLVIIAQIVKNIIISLIRFPYGKFVFMNCIQLDVVHQIVFSFYGLYINQDNCFNILNILHVVISGSLSLLIEMGFAHCRIPYDDL